MIPGAAAVAAGPAGSLFVLSTQAKIPPTPGSWDSSCTSGFNSIIAGATLARLSEDLSKVYWSTCVPFQELAISSAALAVDSRTGSVIVAGTPGGNFTSSSGAHPGPGVIQTTGIVRVKSDGSSSDFAWLASIGDFAKDQYLSAFISGIAVLPDSSIVAGMSASAGLPVTSDAIAQQGPGYLLHLSADGSQSLYATYLPGAVTGLASDPTGKIWFSGQIAGNLGIVAGFNTRLALPFASTVALPNESFVASFDVTMRKLLSFARFGIQIFDNGGMKIAVNPKGQPVLVQQGGTTVSDVSLSGFELDPSGTQAIVTQQVPTTMTPQALGFDAAGNWIVVNAYAFSPMPVTAENNRLSPSYGLSGFLRLDANGNGVVSSTVIQDEDANAVATLNDGTIFVSAEYPFATPLHPEMQAPQPVSSPKPAGAMVFFSYPKIAEVCGSDELPPQYISWDVRGVSPGTIIEVHLGTASGPLLATGNTGVISETAGNNTYVLVSNPGGSPLQTPTQLAVETTSLNLHPVRCSFVANPTGTIGISPNPVVSCAVPPFNAGTAVTVTGYGPDAPANGLLQVRVGNPLGTLFTADAGSVREKTGNWVGNGLEFFLSTESAPAAVLASLRAYVLPVRDCENPTAPPPPAIRATRDCAHPSTFTIAYFTGEPDPVAIRTGGVNGPVVALQDGFYDGLVDLTVNTPTTYYLTYLQNGVWQSLATTVADPAQACGQGAPQ